MDQDLLQERYWLVRPLGRGAMGEVHLAVDTHTQRSVAVKVLSSSDHSGALQMRALWREVRAAARLRHKNIVQVLDYGQTDEGTPFFAMEYVAGKSLEIWRKVLSVRDILEVTDQILSALAFAHARGVVHRDLKPENIIIIESESGALVPKLVDFGVAYVGGLHAQTRTPGDAALSNAVVGTPAYMSPEQAQGMLHLVGPETDLYALGVMLFELVSGTLPFSAPSTLALMMKHVAAPPPPLITPSAIQYPRGLESLVEKLLSKSPFDRYSFAADVRRMLRRLNWDEASDTPIHELSTLDAELQVDTENLEDRPGTLDAEEGEGLLRTVFDTSEDDPDATVSTPGLVALRETKLVGREEETRFLWEKVEGTLTDQAAQLIVLEGASGTGKTRLLTWLISRVEEEGLMQGIGGGVGPNAAFPIGEIRSYLERYLRVQGVPREVAQKTLENQLVERNHFEEQEIGPLMAFLRPETEHPLLRVGLQADPVMMTARILRAASSQRPVLLLFDDLEGPDVAAPLELIEHLISTRDLSPFPILMIATCRSLPEGMGELVSREGVTRLPVDPLKPSETEALAQALLPVTENLAQLIASRSGGNPAFVHQMMNHWLKQGQLINEGDGRYEMRHHSSNFRQLPKGFFELLRTRLGAVLKESPNPLLTRGILGRAALCGLRFPFLLLEQLLQKEGNKEAMGLLDGLTQRLVEEGFWREVEPGIIQFTNSEVHQLTRSHLVQKHDLVPIHAHLAQLKTALYAEQVSGRRAEIAAHYAEAGLAEQACHAYVYAAQDALHTGEFNHAEAHLNEARLLLEKHAIAGATELGDSIDLTLAQTTLQTGDYDKTRRSLESVLNRLRATSRKESLATAKLLNAKLIHKRGNLSEAEAAYEAAEAAFDDLSDLHGLASCLLELATLHASRRNIERVEQVAVAARRLFTSLNDGHQIARCLVIEGHGARLSGDLARSQALYGQAIAAFEDAGAKHQAMRTLAFLGDAFAAADKLDEATEKAEQAWRALLKFGDRPSLIAASRGLSVIYRKSRRLDEAEDIAHKGLNAAKTIGDKLSVARLYNDLGLLARERKAWVNALDNFHLSVDACLSCGALSSAALGAANIGLLHTTLGQWENAAQTLRRACGLARRVGDNRMVGAYLGCLARAHAEVGDWKETQEHLKEALFLDKQTPISERDFLVALDRIAFLLEGENELAKQLLSLTSSRWKELGELEASEEAKSRLARL